MLKYSICQRNRAAGSKVWYLRTFDTVSKKITFESLGTEKKSEAQNALLLKNAERFKSPEEKRLEMLPTIREAVAQWLDNVSRGNPGTYREYANKMPHLFEYCESNKIESIADFTTQHAAGLIEALPKDHKPTTIVNKKRVYSAFFTWVYSRYGIERINPFNRVKTPKAARVEKEFWTVEQIEKILEFTSDPEGRNDPEERFLFAFMAFAGLRFFEAASMSWERIEGGKISLTGKGDKFAKVPIGEKLKREIGLYLNGEAKPSTGRIFRKFLNFSENSHLKTICEKLGFQGEAHCHKFRHSFISNLLISGGSIVAVSKLARHEKPDITLRFYAHCLPDDLDKTLNLL